MSLSHFKQTPWQGSHQTYKNSALAISPAPEYASSEVLIASLYRTIGFQEIRDGVVPQAGRDLSKRLQKFKDKHQSPPHATVDAEVWHSILHGVLESPKLPNQSTKRFLQVSPIVPDIARFSGSARLSSNSWQPGNLIRRMVWLGSDSDEAAGSLWKDLFEALSVTGNDDIFARWLQTEISAWSESSPTWQLKTPSQDDVATLPHEDLQFAPFPARQFVKDLSATIQAKDSMTRRQWISILEAVLRLAAVSHVTWLCDVNTRIWRCVSSALDGTGPLDDEQTRKAIFPTKLNYMSYGDKALSSIKDLVSAYLHSRLGINAVLWALDEINKGYQGELSSSSDITNFCQYIRDNKIALDSNNTHGTIAEIIEREARALLCKKGIGSNLLEFARHTLGQRQTASKVLRGYDQGYVLKKKGASNASPWVVSLGPLSVLALVHCALAGMGGPRSIHQLSQHLSSYGIIVDRHDITKNDLGYQLRMLGLVLDSPDAESGMLLLPPFTYSHIFIQDNEL